MELLNEISDTERTLERISGLDLLQSGHGTVFQTAHTVCCPCPGDGAFSTFLGSLESHMGKRPVYAVPLMCRMLDVSRSGYYAWLKRKPSKRSQEEGRLEVEIRAAHKRTRCTCGPERLSAILPLMASRQASAASGGSGRSLAYAVNR